MQPVYIQRSADVGTYPVLQFVAVSFGKSVGFGQTLDEALRVAVGLQEGDVTPDEGDGEAPDPDAPAADKTTAQYLEDASKFYAQAQKALKDGDLTHVPATHRPDGPSHRGRPDRPRRQLILVS